ncbi:MAG: hypothetical protein ACLQGV_01925 [Bryobacteraceae bacterium]
MAAITRRFFLGLSVAAIQRLLWSDAEPEPLPAARSYRVDATILLFSLPIYTRTNVGYGYAKHLVTRDADRSTHLLEFAARSLPERARGLNRLGMIRETVAENGGGIVEAHYLGFMTASREESLSEAKKALNNSSAQTLFVAIEGESRPEEVVSRRAHFVADARAGAAEWNRLQLLAEAGFRTPEEKAAEQRSRPESADAAPPTFLFALLRAVRSREEKLRQVYVYGRDRFELATAKKPDPRIGQRLATKGVAHRPASVAVVAGTICNLRTGEKIVFRIWTEDGGDAIPLRIEYQPRGYLQLALEAEA